MTLAYPNQIGNCSTGAEVQENFDSVKTELDALQAELDALQAEVDAIVVPTGGGGGGGGGGRDPLRFDPIYTQGLQQTFWADFRWYLPPGDAGWMNPIRYQGLGCVLVPDTVNDRLDVVTIHAGPIFGTVGAIKRHSLPAGSNPVHAVALSNGDIYASCQGASNLPYISKISAAGVVESWADLGANHISVEKIYTNRYGSHLYVVGKLTGDTNHRSVIRVNVATKAIAYLSLDDDKPIVDLVVYYGDSIAPSVSTVLIAQQEEATPVGEIYRAAGDSGPNVTTSFASSPTLLKANPTGQAAEHLHAMVQVGTSVFVVAHYGAVTGHSWALFNYNSVAGYGEVLTGNDTGVTDEVMDGSACFDGRHVWMLGDQGRLIGWRPGDSSLLDLTVDGLFGVPSSGKGCVAFQGDLIVANNGAKLVFMNPLG